MYRMNGFLLCECAKNLPIGKPTRKICSIYKRRCVSAFGFETHRHTHLYILLKTSKIAWHWTKEIERNCEV